MAEHEAILCPGCGEEMTLVPSQEYGVVFGWSYLCHRCGWQSPLKQTQEEAREAAAMRYKEKDHDPTKCRYYTASVGFFIHKCGGCLGTKEIDPCEGEKCNRWESKEE